MMVLSDDTHFVIGALRHDCRLGWANAERLREQVNNVVRLIGWETIVRDGQAVVFINRLTTYSGLSGTGRTTRAIDADVPRAQRDGGSASGAFSGRPSKGSGKGKDKG
eukprot:8751532-Heterocapsa_arctica.AAC.1